MKRVFIFLMILFCISNVSATYEPDKVHSVLKGGDVIYFDSTNLDWDKVFIHIWEKDGTVYKDWAVNDEMTKVTDNIYMFTVPDDIEEKYNMIIFHNEYGGNNNQTIDLGFIEEKYGYITTGYYDEKRVGYWYLYDKSDLLEKLNDLKKYQEDKNYYTVTSYSNLDQLIGDIESNLEGEISLQEDSSHPGRFYIQVDYTFADADDIVNGLEVNTSLLSDLINEEEAKYVDYEKVYTKNSLDILKQVINEKKEVLNSNSIAVNDIKTGINDINNAKDGLINQANKTELKKQLDEILVLDKGIYSEESFKVVEDLFDEANNILSDTNKNQDEVDKMVEKLKSARDNLKIKEVKEESKEETIENNIANVPKTLDNIMKIFAILGGCIVLLVVVIVLLKKIKK